MMRVTLLVLSVAGFGAACAAHDNRQWMKVSEPYTVEEFRRDYADCSKSGKLDDTCLRSRGWVDVSGSKEKIQEPERRLSPGRPIPSSRR